MWQEAIGHNGDGGDAGGCFSEDDAIYRRRPGHRDTAAHLRDHSQVCNFKEERNYCLSIVTFGQTVRASNT